MKVEFDLPANILKALDETVAAYPDHTHSTVVTLALRAWLQQLGSLPAPSDTVRLHPKSAAVQSALAEFEAEMASTP